MRKCPSCSERYEDDSWTCPACGSKPMQIGIYPSFVEDALGQQPEEFDENTYEAMTSFEARSFYIKSRFELMYWAYCRFFPDARSFLDFGGGTGYWLEALADRQSEATLFGTDLSVDSLHAMTRRLGGRATVFHTDAESIPFEDHFDVIGSFDVIEHIDDDVGVLKSLKRPLKKGGGLMITVPQHPCLWSTLDDKTGHKRRYAGTELANKVSDAGYDVILDTGFMASLFVPQYLSRRFLSQGDDSTPDLEHSLPAPVNGLFRAVLAVELAAIKAGLRFPFGGLRIVCARSR
jgi:SAM-dependent methyltransferase